MDAGQKAAESTGWGWLAAVHPADVNRCLARWSAALAASAPLEYHVRLRRAADSVLPLAPITSQLHRAELANRIAGLARTLDEEVPLNWSKWIRQIHRWLAIVFTVAVIINVVAVVGNKYTSWVGLLAVVPVFLLMFTGWYLFALPYATKLREAPRVHP